MEFIPSQVKFTRIEPAFQVGPNQKESENIVPMAWGPPSKVIGRCLITNPNNGQCVGSFPSEYVGAWDEGYKCENIYQIKTAVIDATKASVDPTVSVSVYATPEDIVSQLPAQGNGITILPENTPHARHVAGAGPKNTSQVWFQRNLPAYITPTISNTPPRIIAAAASNAVGTNTNKSIDINNIPSLMAPGTVDRDGFSNPFNVLQVPAQLDNNKVKNMYDAPFSTVSMPYDPTKLYAETYGDRVDTTPTIQKMVRYRSTYNQSYQPRIRGFGLMAATDQPVQSWGKYN